MSSRLALLAVIAFAAAASAATTPRVYVVSWDRTDSSPERRQLIDQADRQLRDELTRRGATVVERVSSASAIVLEPTLEVVPRGLVLRLVGLRGPQRRLLGAVSTRATGSNREAVLRALVTRACVEADQLE